MRALLVYFLTAFTVFAELPADWKNVQQFDVARTGLVRLSLPAETINAARPGARTCGFSIARDGKCRTSSNARWNTVAGIQPQEVQCQPQWASHGHHVGNRSSQTLDALNLETPAVGFIKAVAVEGSTDQHTWRPLANGQPIFRQPNGANQLRVEFPEGVWPFLRVTVDDHRADAIPFTGARLHAVTEEGAPSETLPVRIADRTESDGQTRLTLDLGAAHLTLASLRFETAEPLFTRPVTLVARHVAENAITERELAHDTIYRVDIEGFRQVERLYLPLDLSVEGRELLVLITMRTISRCRFPRCGRRGGRYW